VLVLSQTIYNTTLKNIRPSLSVCLSVFVLIITEHLAKNRKNTRHLLNCLFYFELGNNGYLVESFREQGLPAWLAHPQQVSSKIGELKKRVSSQLEKTEIACSLFFLRRVELKLAF
jgi:hypothetical protein